MAQAIGEGRRDGLLPHVLQAHPAVPHVNAVVPFMANQHNRWALGEVLIVGDVNQQILYRIALNPAMKDWQEVFRLYARGIVDKDL